MPTSVAIVAGVVEGLPRGLSVGTFVPVSLVPPLVGFFVDTASTSWPPISHVGAFAISILSADQADLSRQFAVSSSDKFSGVDWHPAPSGHPVIAGSVAWVDCELGSQTEAGDHAFVLGRVLDLGVETGGVPLLHPAAATGGRTTSIPEGPAARHCITGCGLTPRPGVGTLASA